jgi:hypothetical protein
MVLLYQTRFPGRPWLTQAANSFLESWLRPGDRGHEFGCGRSTLWFATHGAILTSTEHNLQWFAHVESEIAKNNLKGAVTLLLEQDGALETPNSRYVSTLERAPEGSLDFCLIDGVSRDYCALNAIARIKPGGIIIVDNINWYIPQRRPSRVPGARRQTDGFASQSWETFGERVSNWRCIWSTNGEWDTAIWVKPPDHPAAL